MALWRVAFFLALTALAVLSRAQAPDDERLFLKPKNLVTLAVNTTAWTGAWKAPVAGFGSIEAKCVLPNQGCTAPAQGTAFVDASGKAKQGTVTGLSLSSIYDCYVIADPKLLKKDKCSRPVRVTTSDSRTLVYKSTTSPLYGRKLFQSFFRLDTSRCYLSPNGTLTDCIDAGIRNEYAILTGAVDPMKQWITAEINELTMDSPSNLTTCPLNGEGLIDEKNCKDAYSVPKGYIILYSVFDPLARRVWFTLLYLQRGRSLPIGPARNLLERVKSKVSTEASEQSVSSNSLPYSASYGTCAIDAQGGYTGCTQSQLVPFDSDIIGTSPDASGFYIANYTSSVGSFCLNDLSLPCIALSSIPDVGIPTSINFFNETVAYLLGYKSSTQTYATFRCNAVNAAIFTDCQTVIDQQDIRESLYLPANNGMNAYIVDLSLNTYEPLMQVCNVNQHGRLLLLDSGPSRPSVAQCLIHLHEECGSISSIINGPAPQQSRFLELINSKVSPEFSQETVTSNIIGSDTFFATCATDAQGGYSGCAQSQPIQCVDIIGTSPDASEFYMYKYIPLEAFFCKNDLAFPCTALSGIPDVEPFAVKFLTESVVYLTAFNISADAAATYRCNFENAKTFTDCESVFDQSDAFQVLYFPASNGRNAHVAEVETSTFSAPFEVCDVNQVTGVFKDCTVLAGKFL